MNNWVVAGLFVVVWAATFVPAWRLLIQLVTTVAKSDFRLTSIRFWSLFILYRVVIFLPYGVVLVFGQEVPDLLEDIIWGWAVLAIILSLFRFIGVEWIVRSLWYVYGYVYDGLRYFYPYHHLLKLVCQRLGVQDGMRVLDLGCGTGNLGEFIIQDTTVDLVAVDSSPTMLRRARRKLGDEVVVKQQELMDFLQTCPSASFDRIAMVNVVYAVPDRAALWQECLRVLKSNGKIVMTTSVRTGSRAIIREHLRHASFWKLLHPRLLAVGVVDFFISELARGQVFQFPSKTQLLKEITLAGGSYAKVDYCYGGSEKGVNIICDIAHR